MKNLPQRRKGQLSHSLLSFICWIFIFCSRQVEFPSVRAEIYRALILPPGLSRRSRVRARTFRGAQRGEGTTSHCACRALRHTAPGLSYLQELSNICCIYSAAVGLQQRNQTCTELQAAKEVSPRGAGRGRPRSWAVCGWVCLPACVRTIAV